MDQETTGEKKLLCRDSPPLSTSVTSSENAESLSAQKKPSTFPFGSAFDISSSSLIKSPLVSELLISHGLLKNGILEDGPLCSEFSSLGESPESPSYSGVSSLQSLVNWNMLEEEEDEKGEYKCGWDLCDMSFSFRKELAIHVNNSHINQDENSLYRCLWSGCIRHGKAISARYRMLIHMRTHTHEKPHACDVCGKKFSRLENLRIHNRSHTGEKPYVCPVAGCGKAYSNSSDRFKHSKTHQEDKPYVCRVEGCDKRYTDPSSLRKHMKSSAHCGENTPKPNLTAQVNQDLCENINGEQKGPESLLKSSSSNTLLKSTQSKIFDSKRPYACPAEGCDKRYTDPGSLRKHQRATSHGRDPSSMKMKLSRNKQVVDVTSIIKEHRFTENDSLSEDKVNRADLLLGCTLKSTKEIVQKHSPEKEVTKVTDVKACHSVANADLTPLDLSVCCAAATISPVSEEEEKNMQGIEDDAIRS